MDFLKALFESGALTYEQFMEKVQAEKLNLVNLAAGGYVSKAKYDDELHTRDGRITDLQGQITQRDSDLADIKGKLATAQADAGRLGEVQTALTDLQSKYGSEKTAYENRLAQQAYEFAVREKAGSLKFSSESAKRAFLADAIGKGFKQDGDHLLGYDDFVAQYKATDPGAFAPDPKPAGDPAPTPPNPTIVLPGKGNPPGGKAKSLSELMRAKNENPDFQVNFD